MATNQELQQLLAKDESELLMLVGEDLSRDEVGALPMSARQLADRASAWFSKFLVQVRPQLCENPTVRAIREKADSVSLASAIVDVIAKAVGIVTPATVAVLILRIGLDKICQSYPTQER